MWNNIFVFLGPRVFEEVLQVLKEQVSEFAGLKEALGAKKISRLGSQVTVADYSDTFQFAPVAYRHAPESLCWDLERMERFKKSAKQIILSQYIGTMIGFANDPAIREVKDVQPVIAELLHNLISVAYPTPLDTRDLNIGSMEYFDAQITDARSQNVIAFNGKTDFSVIYSPKDISLGGCEIKLPKKGLVDNKRTNISC